MDKKHYSQIKVAAAAAALTGWCGRLTATQLLGQHQFKGDQTKLILIEDPYDGILTRRGSSLASLAACSSLAGVHQQPRCR